MRELAEAAGISPSYVSLIENGHKSPDPAITERIGRALGLDRELQGHEAGIRTHALVALSSAAEADGTVTMAAEAAVRVQ